VFTTALHSPKQAEEFRL